jgi:integrase/recombinase XerC
MTVMGAHIQAYLDYVRFEKRLSERTYTLYHDDLLILQRMLNTMFELEAEAESFDVLGVQPMHIRRLVAILNSQGRNGSGIARMLSSWRGFYKWAGQHKLVGSNPVQDIRAPKTAKPLPKALSVDDAVQLASFNNLHADPALEARDVAMVELLYGSGLRLSELLGLDVQASQGARGWVDMRAGEAQVLGKGGKWRSVPVGAKAAAALQAWLAIRLQWVKPAKASKAQSEPTTHSACDQSTLQAAVFVNQRGQRLSPQHVRVCLRKRAELAGTPTAVHPHMLRHSFASHVLQSSGDLRGVQELLGHANISTTQVYTRLDFQHLALIYDQAHPKAKKNS